MVKYTYSAWGQLLTTTGTMATTLGFHNPLRYRGYVYDSEYSLYYLQSRYYDPQLGRFVNADALSAVGQCLLGNNMFAYCVNNPVRYVDITGCTPEEADEEYRVVGAGVQLEVAYGISTAGIEIIVYWDVEESRDSMVVAIYTYGGYTLDFTNPQLGSIIATIANQQELIVANPERAMAEIISLLGSSYSASISGVLIFGNEKFVSIESYEGPFVAVSGSISHVKAGAAFSDSCFAITLGGTSSKNPSFGVSKTNYTLRASFSVVKQSRPSMLMV